MTTPSLFSSALISSAFVASSFIASFTSIFNFGLDICEHGRQPSQFFFILIQKQNCLSLMLLRKVFGGRCICVTEAGLKKSDVILFRALVSLEATAELDWVPAWASTS